MPFDFEAFYAYRSQFTQEHDATQLLLSALHSNIHLDAKKPLFDLFHFEKDRPYYCCQTGLSGRIYTSRLGITGRDYEHLCYDVIYPSIKHHLEQQGYYGYPYLNHTDDKHLIIVLQETDNAKCSPLEIAEILHSTVQSSYEKHFAHGTGRYINTTVISDPVSGVNGIYEGVSQTCKLHRLSFFRMAHGVLSSERLLHLKNDVHYNQAMFDSNALCSYISAGNEAQSLALLEQLFLHTLKYSFSFERLGDVLSYLKYYLVVRMTVYNCLPEENLDVLLNPEHYITIEECFEAIRPLICHLTQSINRTGIYKTSVATAAYYILKNLNKDISLDDIALYTNTASSHLSSVFHQQTGMTIKQYQAKARIQHACHLLIHTNQRIGDIALECGFFNRRYFTAMFRDQCGMTPQEYRQQNSPQQMNP